MFVDCAWILLGIVLLWAGAEALIGGAANLALRFRMAPRVVGLTVVAFGTSLPELLVSLQAAMADPPKAGIAVGSAVGSNIANVCLILGVGALVAPLVVSRKVLRRDLPIALGFGLGLWALTAWGNAIGPLVSRLDGLILMVALAAFIFYSLRGGRVGADDEVPPIKPRSVGLDVVFVLLGLGFLVVGADRLVAGASSIAQSFGVDDRVIGITVVAFGTSLPELVTTVVAALRGQAEMGLGNVMGSNIFNVGAIVGLTAFVTPLQVQPAFVRLDIPVMLIAMVVLFPYLRTGWVLSRKEGVALVAAYAGYTLWLFL